MVFCALLLQEILTESGAKELQSFSSRDSLVAVYYDRGVDVRSVSAAGADFLIVAPRDLESLAETELRIAAWVHGTEDGAPSLRDFYAKVPVRRWAAIDGRPIAWVQAAASFDIESSRRDFRGRVPYLVVEESLETIPVDRRFVRGQGPRDLDVVSVGPGREEDSYGRSWYVALKLQPPMIAIEEWSEDLVEKARMYVQKYRKKEEIPRPQGKWTKEKRIGFNLKYLPQELGLAPIATEDGPFEIVEMVGLRVLTTKKNLTSEWRYVHFDADDSYGGYFERRSYLVEVEYLDSGSGSFALEYDSADRTSEGRTKRAGEKKFEASGNWKIAKFEVRDAFFSNRQRGGADLRLSVHGRGLAVRKVVIKPR